MKKLIYLAVPLMFLIFSGCSDPGSSIIGPGSTADLHQSLSPDDASQKADPIDCLNASEADQHRERYRDPWAGAERRGWGEPLREPGESGYKHNGP